MGCAPVSALIGYCALVPSITVGGYSTGREGGLSLRGAVAGLSGPSVGALPRPRHCHPVTRRKVWRPIRKFWPCARSSTRSSIPRPGAGRASRHAISPMPRNCSACPRSPASRRSRVNIPVPRKNSAHPAGLHRLGYAAVGKRPVVPSFSRIRIESRLARSSLPPLSP